MSPAVEVALVVQREIRKNLRSAKGLALLGISLMGGVAVALVLSFIAAKEHELLGERLSQMTPEQSAAFQRTLVMTLGEGDEALGDVLAKVPTALLGAMKVNVWIVPALVALLGFDAVSGELQHRTVRFWTVRTRRASYYVGKLLGTWVVVSMLTLFVQVLTWGIVVSRGESVGKVVEWGPRLWLLTLPISLVWCAIAQLIASQFRSPIVALISTFASFFGLWIGYLLGVSDRVHALVYLYPSAYDSWLLHPHLDRSMGGLAICLGSALVYATAGATLFAKADV